MAGIKEKNWNLVFFNLIFLLWTKINYKRKLYNLRNKKKNDYIFQKYESKKKAF